MRYKLALCSMDAVNGYSYSKLLHQFVTSGSDSEVPRPWWDADLECKAPPTKRPSQALCAVCNQHAPHRCGGCKASRYWYACMHTSKGSSCDNLHLNDTNLEGGLTKDRVLCKM